MDLHGEPLWQQALQLRGPRVNLVLSCHYEEGPAGALAPEEGEEADYLHLAVPRQLVGEDARERGSVQAGEPPNSCELVHAQLALQAWQELLGEGEGGGGVCVSLHGWQ